jgi:hypothetical protein
MNPELKETTELVRSVKQFLVNYQRVTRGTADEGHSTRAAQRVESALIDCLTKATGDLATNTDLPMWFNCSFCEAPHDLARDLETMRSPRPLDAPPDYIVLMRDHRYRHDHAKEVVRQLELRGWKSAQSEDPIGQISPIRQMEAAATA